MQSVCCSDCIQYQAFFNHLNPFNPFIMSVYCLKKTQFIPISLDAAWDFFSHPKNLAAMTPEYLNLKFTNELYGDEMYPGQVMT
ncbi:MAG: hypothetical protein RLZZ05_711, partial [Bacteroidota bacterium]